MTVVTEPVAYAPVFPAHFRIDLDRYHRAIEHGVLTESDPVELIEGRLLEKMPIGERHANCVDLLIEYFFPRYNKQYRCRAQNPMTIGEFSEPEPDFALVDRERYAAHSGKPIPADVPLIVEVSDSTLDFDRSVKARLYATAGIPEYWIINLRNDTLELHTRPDAASGDYGSVIRYGLDQTVPSPFCGEVSVAELIPEREEEE